ncbi:MAG: ABC transporter substrate-binding protein [Solirubrobacteraceae bacterium]
MAPILAGCSSSPPSFSTSLPGFNRPQVTIGDKNFTEQFVLGQLYYQALSAQGYQVVLDPNIGPTDVTYQALTSGRLAMYPEYVNVWDTTIAGYRKAFATGDSAYRAGQRWATQHGLELLKPSQFSDTDALAVTAAYARAHGLSTLADLRKVAAGMTIGSPAQFQNNAGALPAVEQAYGFTPANVTPLDLGSQSQELSSGAVQAAYITTTDGALSGGTLRMLRDPRHILGFGNVVPVVTANVLSAEGPAFARTINRVTRLLTLQVMRHLNAQVDIGNQTPAAVARAFLLKHGLVPKGPTGS